MNRIKIQIFFFARKILKSLIFRNAIILRESILSSKTKKSKHYYDLDAIEFFEILKNQTLNTIYDIGANRGKWTAVCKLYFPNSHIVAFEPIEELKNQFWEINKHSKNIRLYNIALGGSENEVKFNITSEFDSSSVLNPSINAFNTYGVEKTKTIIVPQKKLDNFIKINNLPQPDLIKLDIQGYELEALKGGTEAMKSANFILMEVSFIELYDGQPLFEEIIAFMLVHNFRLCTMGLSYDYQKPVQKDVLFVKQGVEI